VSGHTTVVVKNSSGCSSGCFWTIFLLVIVPALIAVMNLARAVTATYPPQTQEQRP